MDNNTYIYLKKTFLVFSDDKFLSVIICVLKRVTWALCRRGKDRGPLLRAAYLQCCIRRQGAPREGDRDSWRNDFFGAFE